MAVQKKKLAKTKRNNQKRNKLVKQGVIKKQKPKKLHKNVPQPQKIPAKNEDFSEESDDGQDMLDMVENEDLDFIKSAIANRSYSIYNKVKYTAPTNEKGRKKKFEEDESLEQTYENDNSNEDQVKYKNLLPIKTKKGVIPQQIVDNTDDKELNQEEHVDSEEDNSDEEEGDEEGKEEYTFDDSGTFSLDKPISEAQLLAIRNEALRQKKIHIGTISSQLLENPEERINNLRSLLNMMDEENLEIHFTIKKLVCVSLLEVFKDLVPSYEIKSSIDKEVKLKKDTLKLHRYEESLLLYYKKYLQKLEKFSLMLRKKRGDSRKRSAEDLKLGELAVHSLCDLLVSHPYFNYSKNIAQSVVLFLNHSNKAIREIVKCAVKTVFKEDKKEEITLHILRIINQYLRNHAHNVNPDMLEVLLVLNLRDVNLDQEKESDIKQKKLNAQKHKLLQMSKKERKRKKKLQMLDKEMLETKAEENKQKKQQNLTEITKILFNIYFRILKDSTNTKVLGVCLEGLSKFAHYINIDFYVDLVNVLDSLLKQDWLGYKEQLHCVQTVFSILSGVGEALNLDPSRFYTSLYKDLLKTHASRNHENFLIVLKTLSDALLKRRKKITNKRTISFVKRLATCTLQLLHNGSLGSLGLIKNVMQLNRSVDILLDLDNSVGDGKYQADLDDPEYANASETGLYEMVMLSRHYHPVVRKYAKHIINGVPASGEGSLPLEYGKCTPEELYTDFSMSEMAFNPAIPVPKKVQPKSKPKRLRFADSSFEESCKLMMKKQCKLGTFL